MAKVARQLKVFLCHASGDKPAVRKLYKRLAAEGVDAWLDQEKLLPGQDWREEIPRAVREADVVIVCISNKSITKEGYVQTEIKFALDIAKEKPEGTIFLIPTRLENCPVPERLSRWQWVDLFTNNGFEQLMRSLHLRANKIGVALETPSDVDQELEQKIDRLYTEGSAALWVEDWDKAFRRFQTILRERPDHSKAAIKLEEAKRQQHLNTLYLQALDARKNEDWQRAVEILENLTNEIPDYKDAALLLKDAQKKNRLSSLYEEAQKLYEAQQWQAVVRIFEHIADIDPDYPDADEVLLSSKTKVEELKRLDELNNLYSSGIHEMDLSHWSEAYETFKQVQIRDPEFQETERLLKKIGKEIQKAEEKQRQEDRITALYERAHSLFRAGKWQEAIDRVDDIRQIDGTFVDPNQIAQQSIDKLEYEQKQDKLKDLYQNSVRLMKERKYQNALEKWQEIVSIDPNYPDNQKVEEISKKQLVELTEPLPAPKTKRPAKIAGAILVLFALISTIASLVLSNRERSPSGEFTANVDARLGWQTTGVQVNSQDRVTIEVIDGQWTNKIGTEAYTTGEGVGYICVGGCVEPLEGFPQDGLIGKIGNNIFGIGNKVTMTSPESGELFLRMNNDDEGSFDNDGILTVKISINK